MTTSPSRLRSPLPYLFAIFAALAAQCEQAEESAEAPLTVETRSVAAGVLGAPYAAQLEASGGSGAYSWTAHGTLPPGLTLTADSGWLAGTPAAAGQYTFSVQVSDGRGTARRMVALTVGTGGQLGILAGAIGPATARSAFNHALQALGGTPPYDWSLAAGAMPPGLALDAATGVIAGVPSEGGSFSFTLRLRDGAGGIETRPVTLLVNPPPAITSSSLAGGTVGRAYREMLQATGGTSPHAWIVTEGGLPAGLSLDAGTGAIGGTPLAPGVAAFTVRVADAAGASAARPFSIAVAQPLAIAGMVLPSLTVERPFTFTLPVVGGTPPYAWRLKGGALPTGLAMDASGAILGTPTVAGAFEFAAEVTDATAMSATRVLRMTVVPAPTIVTTMLPAGRVRRAYRQSLRRSGGTAPLVWSTAAGALPAGLALDAATGLITGTPTEAGRNVFTVRVTDASGAGASRQLAIQVR